MVEFNEFISILQPTERNWDSDSINEVHNHRHSLALVYGSYASFVPFSLVTDMYIGIFQELQIDFSQYEHPVVLTIEAQVKEEC